MLSSVETTSRVLQLAAKNAIHINLKSSVEVAEMLIQSLDLKSQNAVQLYDVMAETRLGKLVIHDVMRAMAWTEVLVKTFKIW